MSFEKLLFGFKNAFRKAAMGFDMYGCRYHIEYLNAMFPKILYLSIEEQAKFADYITITNYNKDWYINGIISISDEPIDVKVNTVGVGNIAYVALNCKNEKVRDIMIKRLEYLTEYYK